MSGGTKISEARICLVGNTVSGTSICPGGNTSYQEPQYVRGLKYCISRARKCPRALIFHIRGQNMSGGLKYFISGARIVYTMYG